MKIYRAFAASSFVLQFRLHWLNQLIQCKSYLKYAHFCYCDCRRKDCRVVSERRCGKYPIHYFKSVNLLLSAPIAELADVKVPYAYHISYLDKLTKCIFKPLSSLGNSAPLSERGEGGASRRSSGKLSRDIIDTRFSCIKECTDQKGGARESGAAETHIGRRGYGACDCGHLLEMMGQG